MDQLHDSLEADYELGCVIKDKIIPRAVAWFTGAAVDPEDEYDDDDDEPPPAKGKGKGGAAKPSGSAAAAPGGPKPGDPECKQQ